MEADGNLRNHEVEEVDAGDVLVVGGGAAGLLIGVELVRRGAEVCVVDAIGAAAAQSGHHHGLRHAGSLYIGSNGLVDALAVGSAGWEEWLSTETPTAAHTVIPIWDPFRVEYARAWWAAAGLEVERLDAVPAWVSGAPAVFETTETVYDFSGAFRRMCDGELKGRTVQLAVSSLVVRDGTVEAVMATRPDGRLVRVSAGKFVLAAGTGLSGILRRSNIGRQRLTVRTSFMMVIEAAGLPATAMISVEPELGGIFTGPRAAGDDRRWLVGDHLSMAGNVEDPVHTLRWLHSCVERMRSLTALLDGPGVRVGAYAAPKAELRDDPNNLLPFSIESYGLSNAVVVTPTKLTLAPALAARAVEVVGRLAANARRARQVGLEGISLEVLPERWCSVETVPVEELESRRW